MIATIILLAVIVLGALYFWKARSSDTVPAADTSAIESQSSSDEAAAIQGDLNSTNVENVDYDLNASNFTSS